MSPADGRTLGGGDTTSGLTFHRAGRRDVTALLALGHDASELPDLISGDRWLAGDRCLTILCRSRQGDPLGSTTAIRIPGTRTAWMVGFSRVTPAARGQGIGGAMGAERDRLLVRLGAEATFSTIRPDNTPSLALATRLGYAPVAWKTQLAARTAGAPRQDVLTARELAGRAAVMAIGRLPAFQGIATGIATRARPLGLFPPVWTFPRHELRRMAGRNPHVLRYSRTEEHHQTIAVAWQDVLVLGRGVTGPETGLTCAGSVAGRPAIRTLFSLDRPELDPATVVNQWQVMGMLHPGASHNSR